MGKVITAGYYGRAIAGNGDTAIVGYGGTAIAGVGGTATAGDYGKIIIKYFDCKNKCHRLATGYIGVNGLKPNVAYKLDDNNQFIEAKEQE